MRETFSKLVGRTVMILTASLLLTVESALPAYMGRTNVSSPCTKKRARVRGGGGGGEGPVQSSKRAGGTLMAITSVIGETFINTARRGITLLMDEVVAPTTCVYLPAVMMSFRVVARFSGRKCPRAGLSATMTPSTPAALEASLATAAQSEPATSTCTLPNFLAAVMALRVAALRTLLLWSAMTRDEPKRLARAELNVDRDFLAWNISAGKLQLLARSSCFV